MVLLAFLIFAKLLKLPMVIFFAKKSYTAGKFTEETEKSASSEEVMEVGMKSTRNV